MLSALCWVGINPHLFSAHICTTQKRQEHRAEMEAFRYGNCNFYKHAFFKDRWLDFGTTFWHQSNIQYHKISIFNLFQKKHQRYHRYFIMYLLFMFLFNFRQKESWRTIGGFHFLFLFISFHSLLVKQDPYNQLPFRSLPSFPSVPSTSFLSLPLCSGSCTQAY